MEIRDQAELDAYLQPVDKLTLKINATVSGTPVQLVSAQVEKGAVPLAVTCPGGVEPSLKRCKPRP
jgi:hypothetical protein